LFPHIVAAPFMNVSPLSPALFLAIALTARAEFPAPYNSETDMSKPLMPAAEAAASFEAPPGFKVSVFASEPDVQNPIAMSWDARGRLWIAENYTYAERPKKFDLGLRDRVVIFDGTSGPRFTKRTVFTDDVQMLTSVEVGLGGVWLMCPPQLLFIPDRNADDKPDGPAEVMLDGFTPPAENYHNFANGLRVEPRRRGRARHTGGGSHSAARDDVALPSAHEGLRGAEQRLHEPVGARLE
jgi:putative membrane-bound dehydrogenase-like protein